MKPDEVANLINSLDILVHGEKPILVQTQISWVILAGDFAYKIKKPVHLSFLDFSTVQKRKYYCERELFLNKRLAPQMYLRVIPVRKAANGFSVDNEAGEVVDYALLMKRMDAKKEMDYLLKNQLVTAQQITTLAEKIASFHGHANPVRSLPSLSKLKEKFNDLRSVLPVVQKLLNQSYSTIISTAISYSDNFLDQHQSEIMRRYAAGFIRDVHGDMHTGNIFLYDDPVIFDCLEFDDDMRHVDILDEVAFLCMDLDAFGRPDFSSQLYNEYLNHIQAEPSDQLFLYYKAYRANVRAKVYLLKPQDTDTMDIETGRRYLDLLSKYLQAKLH